MSKPRTKRPPKPSEKLRDADVAPYPPFEAPKSVVTRSQITENSGQFDKHAPDPLSFRVMNDQRGKDAALDTEAFGNDPAAAERNDPDRLSFKFRPEAQPASTSVSEPPLCIPEGDLPKYMGKKVSGNIYTWLENTYSSRDGGELLTLEFLRTYDPKALEAFRNERKKHPNIPRSLLILTDAQRGSRRDSIFQRHNIDLTTDEGVREGKRLMAELGRAIYRHPN